METEQDHNPNQLLTEEQVDRLFMSFIESREALGMEVTEEELMALAHWATLAIVNYTTFQLLMDGKLEIAEFKAPDDIEFRLNCNNTLADQIECYVNRLFKQDGA